ncbi:hypothetical protein [Sphingomonas adhaesiva]|uniref:hypothetical protein n=1 Tax=Sphingomonas adhaesiva TaxID=28212 RepID=UPI002FF4A357
MASLIFYPKARKDDIHACDARPTGDAGGSSEGVADAGGALDTYAFAGSHSDAHAGSQPVGCPQRA